jgi:hypothetical protein
MPIRDQTKNSNKGRFAKVTALFFIAFAFALPSSTAWQAVKLEAQGIHSLSKVLGNPLLAFNKGDSSMYILQSYAISENLHLLTRNDSVRALANSDLNLDDPRVRDQIYLAHIDRTRLLYPLLTSLLRAFVGDYSFGFVNLLCLLGIIVFIFKEIELSNYLEVIFASILVTASVFQFMFFGTPEILCYLLLIIFISTAIKSAPANNKVNIVSTIILLLLLATKPLFVITGFFSILMFSFERTRIYLVHALISILSALIWVASYFSNYTPSQLLNGQDAVKRIFSWNFNIASKANLNTTADNLDAIGKSFNSINSLPIRLISELNTQITLDQRISFIAIIAPLIFLFTIQNYRYLCIALCVYGGALITQGLSGSFGINFRYINYGILTTTLLAVRESRKYKLEARNN